MKPAEAFKVNHDSGKLLVTTSNHSPFYNLRSFFGGFLGSVFFWFPTLSDEKYEGYYWPQAGVSREQFLNNMSEQKTTQINYVQVITEDIEDTMELAQKIYGGNTILYFNENAKVEA